MEDSKVLTLFTNSINLPGVKVDRVGFLSEILKIPNDKLPLVLDKGPIDSGVYKIKDIKKISESLARKRTIQTSTASFLSGLPGGFGMAATIPADIAQNFAFSLRLAQEIAYLYGHDDFFKNGELDEDAKATLLQYISVMFGVSGAASTLRILTKVYAQKVAKDIAKKSLTKTVWYPILKNICKYLGIKMTKDIAAKSTSKAIPILGGIFSGGLTYYSMSKMTSNLINALEKGVIYTEKEKEKDLETMKKESPEIYEAIFEEYHSDNASSETNK